MASRNQDNVHSCGLCHEPLSLEGDNWHCLQCTVDLCACCYEQTGGGRVVLVIDNKVEHTYEHAMRSSKRAFGLPKAHPCTRTSRPALGDQKQKLPNFPPGVKKPVLYFYSAVNNPHTAIRVTIDIEPWAECTLANVYPSPLQLSPNDTQDCSARMLRSAVWDIVLNPTSDPHEACSFTVNKERYPYLYWDTTHRFPPLEHGSPGVDTTDVSGLSTYVKRLFCTLGYNERETTDFYTYWIAAMSSFTYISFRVITARCLLKTNPPMPILRNWIVWTGHTQHLRRVEVVRDPSLRPTHDMFPVYAVEWGATHAQ